MSRTQQSADREQERITDDDGNAVESALVGDDLELSYPTSEETIVDCARLDIPEGAVTALVGPNGSGKSTLLKALSKHLEPNAGSVQIHGKDLDAFSRKELAREMGVLSQENDSLGSISVEDLIYHGRYPHRGFFDGVSEEDQQAVERAIELAGIDHLRESELGQLSGGQKQLAWIAMVLAQDTDVLLLDEPTTFLDIHHQFRVLETIRQLNEERGVTVAVILHDISQAARFADYLVAMCDGELYDWGPPEEVVTEQLLADVFGVEATVEYEPELQVLPKRALPDSRT
ncbi:ABC transporter-related protein [Natrinema pellirubrum DSM 15624]|uniref:Cobalamin import ATP-binding protein BtuD n=1 Tax=Natrinema pellirubrum (strain DSM 15624 / CIP 106293 / JCM 10476 / NCIMB 786 / 157) TaxID=797303 RepID=L0JQC0_NATP1|nr:ABC transporter ATP-binding protein [Natrinema pellirubrum]AGB33424.1 ABC-type cobalamin/Fe3+-siderophore transport system, ATPase component [Natrinema pellirubrum DSM 15624]ELY71252.1 ABC transporter-related protein [Natrinema pellirubrum DSM 15624]